MSIINLYNLDIYKLTIEASMISVWFYPARDIMVEWARSYENVCYGHMQTTKAQISLRIRAVWSTPLLFAA